MDIKRKHDKPIMLYLSQPQAVMLDELVIKFSNQVSKANKATVMRLALETLYSQVISLEKEK